MKLVSKYCLFAGLAIITNLVFQDLTLRLYQGSFQVALSILVGTLAGLIVKYALDKRYIFYFQARHAIENSKKFLVYSLMGVITTLVFLGFEISFELIFRDKTMRFIGGFLGLCIGYLMKYRLDKKYVFQTRNRGT